MPKVDSTASTLIVAALVAVAIAYTASNLSDVSNRSTAKTIKAATPVDKQATPPTMNWSASAPGRVESWGGEIRIAAEASGTVTRVVVKENDSVKAGDVLLVLDDRDARLRLRAAQATEALRERQRDSGSVSKSVRDRRKIQDNFAEAERDVHEARIDLDQALLDLASNKGNAKKVTEARTALAEAKKNLKEKREAWIEKQDEENAPLPTRSESALTNARTALALAERALERTRIRAPSDGTVLRLNIRAGEAVAPSPQSPVAVMGDISRLRVRAEVEERDISKIRIGQTVTIKSNSFPKQEFSGKVYQIAKSLGGRRLSARGPRKPTDLDVLETMIEVKGADLLPGMRVEVYFKPYATAQKRETTSTN